MLKLTITGCTGRMGQIVLKEVNQNPDVEVAGALTRPGNLFVGQDIGNFIGEGFLNLLISDTIEKAFKEADVVIDFSHPDALEKHLTEAIRFQKPYVVCLTGLNEDQQTVMEKASENIPLLVAPNTSLAMVLLRKLACLTAEILGPSYDVSILDMHHRHKSDAPSGTSLSIAKALTRINHQENTIECVSLRGGGIRGDHSVIFTGEKDMITLEHRTFDRTLFAQGAIKAAQWLFGKANGFYSMDDVVGISL